ncbi:Ribonuclease P protein subunit p30 [Bonamia ostreae]|uniref:Ribonuclease P protein subunit p30 n=1 Tax=Bonamia ostreae TaxID=126728 RepID=A0ABV2AIG8_9EUKA
MAGFCDFNLVWRIGKAAEMARHSKNLGYSVIAFDKEVDIQVFQQQKEAMSQLNFDGFDKIANSTEKMRVLKRITIKIEKMSDLSAARKIEQNLPKSQIDLVAIKTRNEKIFHSCCEEGFFDIICLDFAEKNPFLLKRKSLKIAHRRRIMFEVCYSDFIEDESKRLAFMQNFDLLGAMSSYRNLLLSSGTDDPMLLRGPYDLINFCSLFKMDLKSSRASVLENAHVVFERARSRESFLDSVASKEIEQLSDSEKLRKRPRFE